MENDIKTRSIRADNESFEKFKAISEEFQNQAQALSALISVYEIEKSRVLLPERQAEIDSFVEYTKKINEMYNYSLLLNHDAQLRIRGEFENRLASKDICIQDLQNDLKNMEALRKENKSLKSQIIDLEKKFDKLLDEKNKLDSLLETMNEINSEYKSQSDEIKKLKSDLSAMIDKNRKLEDSLDQYKFETRNLKHDHEKDLEYITKKMGIEKDKEIIELQKLHNENIAKIHEEYQIKMDEIYKKIEHSMRK